MAEQYNDEIDLGELIVKIRKTMVRNKIWIVTMTLAGLLCGLAFYLIKKPVYQSEIVMRAHILNEPLLKVLNENLTRIIQEGSTESLSAKLKITPEIAKEIQEISISNAAEEEVNNSFYVISIKSLSNEHWEKLKVGIVGYLTNNEYVRKRIKFQEELYQSLISKLNEEIRSLDSLKFNIGTAKRTGNANFIVMNPSETYSTLIRLYQQRQKSLEDLEYNTAVEIVEEFNSYQRPISPRPVFSMGVGAMIGLVLSFILVGAKELDGYLKKYDEV